MLEVVMQKPEDWTLFTECEPEYDQLIAAINIDDPEWCAVGVYRNKTVWQGSDDLNGFTHWLPLPRWPGND